MVDHTAKRRHTGPRPHKRLILDCSLVVRASAIVVLSAALFPMGTSALAQRFELVKGKGEPVCSAYLESLEKSSAPSLTQLICDRPKFARSSTIERFSTTELDLWQHRAFYNDANRYLRDAWPLISENKAEFDEYQKLGGPPVSLLVFPANVDLDNDGTPDHIVKIRSKRGTCGKGLFYDAVLFAQGGADGTAERVNELKTAKLLYGSGFNEGAPSAVMDLFRFRGEYYFDFVRVAPRAKDRSVFYVMKLDKNEDWPANVCQVRPIPGRQK